MDITTQPEIQTVPSTPDEKKAIIHTFIKLGIFILTIIAFRLLINALTFVFMDQINMLSPDGKYAMMMGTNLIFLQLLPLLVAKLLFRKPSIIKMMKKPDRMNKAMGYFPAVYGIGYLVNIIVVIFTALFIEQQEISDSVIVYDGMFAQNPLQGLMLVAYVVILGPIIEEVVYRGILFHSLKPCGTVFAIVLSSFCFGMAHGNFKQLFFTIPVGLLLAYLTYATKSILPSVFIHIILNGFGAVAMLFASALLQMEMVNTEPTLQEKALNTAFFFFIIIMFILVVAGIASFIKKLRVIRRYRIPRENQLSVGKRVALLFTTALFPLSVLLFSDFFFNNYILSFIYKLIRG